MSNVAGRVGEAANMHPHWVLLVLLCGLAEHAVAQAPAKSEPGRKEPQVLLSMPGEVFKGPLPPLTEREKDLAKELKADVEKLATEIGERNVSRFHYDELVLAEKFLQKSLEDAGYKVERQAYKVRGVDIANLIAEIAGGDKKDEIVVVGGHYDSVVGSPGANDNGTGAAATLALARAFARQKPARTLRFVLFVNEEPPWFQTEDMGSLVYAKRCKERKENIAGMLSLETIGYYSDEKGSQSLPPPFGLVYPDTGNYIAFVGDLQSGSLAQQVVGTFRKTTQFPAYGCAVPDGIVGVGFSDQWSFWQMGYPGLMVTDTALFRYPHYHTKEDTPDKVDFERTARVVAGLQRAVADLAGIK